VHIARTIAELRQWRGGCTGSVGFVPTMGALHGGHRALLDRMRSECDHAVASIFVNPKQFGPTEDLAAYPRPLDADLAVCEAAGVNCVFVPDASEVYPAGASTVVEVHGLDSIWEGAARPDHFGGVALVVLKLFNLVQPQRAYFGEKDYQQLKLIQRMVADLNLAVEVVPCRTVREADGLALSSRNAYLSAEERALGPLLYAAMQRVQQAYAGGQTSNLAAVGRALLEAQPEFAVDYFAVVGSKKLQPLQHGTDDSRIVAAVRLGGTRLIDNAPLAAAVPTAQIEERRAAVGDPA
jgi:pantoate--beta-alanine ligase